MTERRRLAETAAEAAARLDEAQAVAHVGTWSIETGDEGDVEIGALRWSAEALRILGLPPDTGAVDPVFFYTLVHPDDLGLVRDGTRATTERGEHYDVEHRVVRPDGEVVLVHERGDVVRDDGRIVRFVGTIEDVTERRELERRLETAQRMEAIGRLASGVAHDFNNQLLVISGNAEIALEDLAADDPAREPVEAIASAALRSAGITRELLAFARRQRADPRPIRLDRAVDDLVPAIRDLLPPTVLVDVGHAPDVPVVIVDQAALERILVNLATNARDAMPDGGTLSISTGVRRIADGTLRGVLTVTDFGRRHGVGGHRTGLRALLLDEAGAGVFAGGPAPGRVGPRARHRRRPRAGRRRDDRGGLPGRPRVHLPRDAAGVGGGSGEHVTEGVADQTRRRAKILPGRGRRARRGIRADGARVSRPRRDRRCERGGRMERSCAPGTTRARRPGPRAPPAALDHATSCSRTS